MIPQNVYICRASTGEYSDRTEFSLHGYFDEQQAKDFVARSDRLFLERWEKCCDGNHKLRCKHFAPGWHPECPGLDVPDYTGYTFWYEAVEVRP